MNINEVHVAIFFGVIGILSGLLQWILNSKVRTEILENNAALNKEFEKIREKINSEDTKNFNQMENLKTKIASELLQITHSVSELRLDITEKIFCVLDEKYITKEMHAQALSQVAERLTSFKQLLEIHLDRIEKNLESQIIDLKDRLITTASISKQVAENKERLIDIKDRLEKQEKEER